MRRCLWANYLVVPRPNRNNVWSARQSCNRLQIAEIHQTSGSSDARNHKLFHVVVSTVWLALRQWKNVEIASSAHIFLLVSDVLLNRIQFEPQGLTRWIKQRNSSNILSITVWYKLSPFPANLVAIKKLKLCILNLMKQLPKWREKNNQVKFCCSKTKLRA